MAPSCLFTGVGVVDVAKVYSNYVVRTEYLFYGPYDGCLGLSLREVIGDEGCTNAKLRWVVSALIVGDANL